MVQNGPNDHFGHNDLIPNRTESLAFARPKWTKMVHFGPFWPKEVHFGLGPFSPPTVLWPFLSQEHSRVAIFFLPYNLPPPHPDKPGRPNPESMQNAQFDPFRSVSARFGPIRSVSGRFRQVLHWQRGGSVREEILNITARTPAMGTSLGHSGPSKASRDTSRLEGH